MAGSRTLQIVISGDAKKALGAFAETEAGAGGLGSKLQGLGPLAATAGVAIGAGVLAAGAALYKVGEAFDDAYDTIRTNTGKTGDQLDALKDDFRKVVTDVPTDFGKASDAISGVSQKLDLTGQPLEHISEQFLELSRITKTDLKTNLDEGTGALNNWGIAAGDQGPKLDELFRASQASGVSFSDLSKQLSDTGPVLRDLGFNFDQSTALLATLGKAGVDTGDVMPALGKSLASAAKDGKNAGDVFRDTFDKIKGAPDDTAAAGVALDVFGAKAGPKLAGLIREGKLSLDDLQKTIAGGSDTILGAGQDTQDFAEKWELFKNRVMVWLEPLATKVFTALGQAMDALPGIVSAITPYFEQFKDTLVDVAGFISDHLPEVIGGLAAVVIGIGVPAFIAWAASAAAAAVATLAAAAPVIAVGVAVAALGAGLVYAYENFDGFRAVVDAVAAWLRDTAWPIMQTVFAAIITAVQAVITFVTDHWDQIHAVFEAVWIAVSTVWTTVVVPLFTAITTVVGDTVKFVTDHWDQIQSAFSTAWGLVKTYWDSVVIPYIDAMKLPIETVVKFVTDHWDQIRAVFQVAWDALALYWNDVVVPFYEGLKLYVQTAVGVVTTAFDLIRTSFEDAWNLASAAWNNVGAPIFDAITGIVQTATDTWNGFVDFVAGLPGRLASAASGMWDWIWADFKAAVNSVIGAWNDLGIPSFHIHITMPSEIPNIDFDTPSLDFPNIPYLAQGTKDFPGGLAWLGEYGKELVNLPGGTQVLSNHDSMAIGSGLTADDLDRAIQVLLAIEQNTRRQAPDSQYIGERVDEALQVLV